MPRAKPKRSPLCEAGPRLASKVSTSVGRGFRATRLSVERGSAICKNLFWVFLYTFWFSLKNHNIPTHLLGAVILDCQPGLRGCLAKASLRVWVEWGGRRPADPGIPPLTRGTWPAVQDSPLPLPYPPIIHILKDFQQDPEFPLKSLPGESLLFLQTRCSKAWFQKPHYSWAAASSTKVVQNT